MDYVVLLKKGGCANVVFWVAILVARWHMLYKEAVSLFMMEGGDVKNDVSYVQS